MIVRNNISSTVGPYGIELGPALGGVATIIRANFPEEIEQGVQALLTAARPLFGPNEVAPGFSLFPEPLLNINDDLPEATSFSVPDEPYLFSLGLLAIGGTFGPNSELFGRAVNLNFDRDADDDDAFQVLSEMITGQSGAAFDTETDAGIDNVTLISLTSSSYTLAFDNGVATDVLTLEGIGVENAIEQLSEAADFGDGVNSLAILGENTVSATGPGNPVPDILIGELNTGAEIRALGRAALDTEDDRVELLALESDALTVKVNDADTGAFDIVVLEGVGALKRLIARRESSEIDPTNTISEYVIADVDGTDTVAPGLAENELLAFLQTVDEQDGVNAIDQGDSIRLEFAGAGGTKDIIVFETDEPVPGGAFDTGLFLA